MLDANIKTQLKTYLERLRSRVEIVASLDDSDKALEMSLLLDEISALSPQVDVRNDGLDARRPCFSIGRPGEAARIRFAGVPLGHEFNSLVLALLHTGGHPPKIEPELADQVRALQGEFHFETYVSLSCHNCPDVVQALNLMAALNPRISHTMIDGLAFREETKALKILAVPTILLNGEPFGQGRMTLEGILAKVDEGAAAREAKKISEKAVFDVLVVGGGPAGAAAAIYAARKGLRTGIVAERFGGQVLDTQAIENFISVKEIDGVRFASALEQHVREYAVDVIDLQRAEALQQGSDGVSEVRLAGGAVLKGRTLIVSTGARWREIGVPGEKAYRGRGVAYCPHCDGPLFKGKRVAVIGGGNSGVEAAIDLAGVVGHVTLIEFDAVLRADAVLQRKLHSLRNVSVITHAQTTEVEGDGEKARRIVYHDRSNGARHVLELEGVFVQIGLLPNTEWLKGVVDLTPQGEIVVDDHGRTSLAGVFAAGDCTTVPYKQIVIAVGEGAKAALAAFEHLVRTSAVD